MAIKKYGPTTPGRRGMTVTDYSVLSKVAPERSLLEPMKKHSGRNNTGRITVRHQGGGNRTKYRVIDFKRQKTDMPATVKTLEYDPNRSAFIALVEYTDGVKNYIIAPAGLKVVELFEGNGPMVRRGDTVTVNYHGVVWGKDTPFDSSFDRHQPATFGIGVGQVIKGWDQTVPGHNVGSRLVVSIPPEYGYGSRGVPQAGIGGEVIAYIW